MHYFKNLFSFLTVLIFLVSLSGQAQDRAQGPWWPNALWGAGDQAGGSNWITPEKILQSIKLVKTGKIYELGHIYQRGMPMIGQRSYNIFIPAFPTSGPYGENKVVYNDDFIASEIGQVGTQFDGPGHVGMQMTLADGTFTEVFYNGYMTADMKHPYGLQKLGIENVKPIITKGILFDIAGYKNVDILPQGYEITLEDVKGAMSKQGLTDDDLDPGDALLFNSGWWRHWPEEISVSAPKPFVSLAVVNWIIEQQACMVGSDANLDGAMAYVHTEATMKNGIFNLEFMNFESILPDKVYKFLFVFTPLRLKGATGSPGRPIAIY